MLVTDRGQPVALYPVSTSKFGLSSAPNSYGTPLGKHRVTKKIGHGLPEGAVFKSRRFTGEVLPVDAPGRDPIVTRILWLDGREPHNRNSYTRYIYIHGTPEERNIGLPVSYGCVRMRSRDVVALYDRVGVGAKVDIFNEPLAARFPQMSVAASPEATREL
jgi:lipoprotein-anchoring transpeptidase ErfK/SrfK